MGANKELLEKEKNNIWDDIREVFPAIQKALSLRKEYKWSWIRNSRCKYISVRIDMRDGACILMDRNGNRILVKDLLFQHEENR